jgi:hypothetical protein
MESKHPVTGEEPLTAAQVADLAHVSREAVRKAIGAGRIQAKRVGPVWSVERAEALAFAQSIRDAANATVDTAKAKLERAKERARKVKRTPRSGPGR